MSSQINPFQKILKPFLTAFWHFRRRIYFGHYQNDNKFLFPAAIGLKKLPPSRIKFGRHIGFDKHCSGRQVGYKQNQWLSLSAKLFR